MQILPSLHSGPPSAPQDDIRCLVELKKITNSQRKLREESAFVRLGPELQILRFAQDDNERAQVNKEQTHDDGE